MVELSTTARDRVKVLSTNSTDSSAPTFQETLTQPSGAGVLNTAGANQLLISPFGTDAANEVFDIYVVGWWHLKLSYGYNILLKATCTISAEAGVAGGDVIDTDLYCDAIASASGIATRVINATVADTPAVALIDLLGCSWVEFKFDTDTAASANALYSLL